MYGILQRLFDDIILNFTGSFPGVYPGITRIVEYPALCLLDIPRTRITGIINWRQCCRMGARKNQLYLYLWYVTVTMLCSLFDGLHRTSHKIKA